MVDTMRRHRSVHRWRRRSIHANFDGVHQAIANGRRERQTVFVPDEFRDFCIHGIEIVFVRWEIRAPAGTLSHLL